MFDIAKKWLLIGAVMLIIACGNKDKAVKIPNNIIPPTEMVGVLVDFHLAEAAIRQAQEKNLDVNQISNQYYYSLLKKHGITRKKYAESLQFYSQNSKEYQKIYKEVVVELSKMQSFVISKKAKIESEE